MYGNSFYLWEMIVAPECMKAAFLTRRGALKLNESNTLQLASQSLHIVYHQARFSEWL